MSDSDEKKTDVRKTAAKKAAADNDSIADAEIAMLLGCFRNNIH